MSAGPFTTLRLDQVSLTFPDRDRPAVDAMSLTIAAGQTVAFVGENGSGKTTLAAILTGLRQPDAGTVWWDNHQLADLDPAPFGHTSPPSRRIIGTGRSPPRPTSVSAISISTAALRPCTTRRAPPQPTR